jgi:hypothetical protein
VEKAAVGEVPEQRIALLRHLSLPYKKKRVPDEETRRVRFKYMYKRFE